MTMMQDPRKLTVSRLPVWGPDVWLVSQDVPVVPPEIHAMTDSAGSDGGASSGFLDMFARDLDPSEPMRTVPDTEEDLAPEHSDHDSVMSSPWWHPKRWTTIQRLRLRHPLQQFRWGPKLQGADSRAWIWLICSRFGRSEAIW